jgi:PAS domain S-box-containing protein
MFRLLGDIFYLLAIIIFIVATFYEYHYVFRKGEKLQNNSNYLKSLFLVFASFSINFILIVMVVLLFIVLVMLLRIYLKQKSITHISMFLTVMVGLYTIITTFLNNFGIEGTWELSYIGNITLITFLLITALAAPIEDRIKESEEKFRVITEQSFIGALIEQDLDIKYVNPQFSKVIGYSTKELLNWKLTDFYEIFHLDDLHKFKELVEKKTKDLIQDIPNFQFRLIKKTGEIIWLELFSKAIMYRNKPANLAFVLEITEKREAERLIIEENKRLIELEQMRTNLITRISHELKTPLTSIFAVSQMLMQKENDLDIHNISEFINILHSGSVRLKELVENLIDASRLDFSKLELIKKKENFVIILENCVREMMHLVNSRDLNMYSDLPDQLYFEVDKLRFEQVIINLLSNAIKNTPRGGNIFITLSETEGNIEIKVRDTGVGLTNEEKKMLFKKFGKIERYGQDLDVDIEGAGLGLYISKEIVELHGGKIWVESDGRNKGSTFIVRLFILKKDD